jgi:glycosyltransferase involved in cell wall biosynthesis
MKERKDIRVLHVIDSLATGGAEQMAVNMANALAANGIDTSLAVTHGDGLLHQKVSQAVSLTILHKRNALDIRAFRNMLRLVREKKINVIHAHSSSVFWSCLVKMFYPGIMLIWHDHYGKSEHLAQRPVAALRLASFFVDHVVAVNEKLKKWSEDILQYRSDKVTYLRNFAVLQTETNDVPPVPGDENRIRIICVANLRPQKDHTTLLQAYQIVARQLENVSLHLIGENPKTDYSEGIISAIESHPFHERIYYHGAQSNVSAWLRQMHIGVLSSASEGLPVSLLEYGMAGLQIVATQVGQVGEVLGDGTLGTLVPPSDAGALARAIEDAIDKKSFWPERSDRLRKYIYENYSESRIIERLIQLYSH